MYLDEVPPEIANLTEVEKRLLSRIIPFVKIIKLCGRFGQYGFKGQTVLFAQDVAEIAEQLPLNITSAGLAFIVEERENIGNCRQYYIDIDRLKKALTILKDTNPLYHDVQINFESPNSDVSLICQDLQNEIRNVAEADIECTSTQLEIQEIAGDRGIVRGSFHQRHSRFSDSSRGKQCTANAAVAIVASKLRIPSKWTGAYIDNMLISGDRLYRDSIILRNDPHPKEIDREYLNVDELQTTF